MNQNKTLAAIDPVLYDQNRQRLGPADLEPFAGQWVAISGDGTRVVAFGQSVDDLARVLADLGIEGSTVVWERLPAAGEDTWL
jgi:hypothetical protein